MHHIMYHYISYKNIYIYNNLINLLTFVIYLELYFIKNNKDHFYTRRNYIILSYNLKL